MQVLYQLSYGPIVAHGSGTLVVLLWPGGLA